MSLSRPVLAAAAALFAVAPATAVAQSPTPATLELSAAGKRALKPSKLTLSSGKLTVSEATIASSATLRLSGSLRLKSGKRSLTATRLQLTIGRTSSSVSARLAGRTVRLLTVRPTVPATIDTARGAVTLTGARVSLTAAAAKTLRTRLKLKRTPSTATLGKLSVRIPGLSAPPVNTPAPAPVPVPAASPTPAPTVAPTPTPAPGGTSIEVPAGSCDPARMSATPTGFVDWFGCDLPGNYDLRSWTRYVLSPTGGCSPLAGTVVASGGATRLRADSAYDHRLPVSSTVRHPDGRITVYLDGAITYSMPAHAIDEQIRDLEIEIDAGGLTGTVYAYGRAAPRGAMSCTPSYEDFGREPLMDLDVVATAPDYLRAQAKIAAPATRLGGGGIYAAGQPWGTFTIPVPAR